MNQKGGVGKTTVCANLAYALSKQDYKVLVLDIDPQGHLGQSFGFFNNNRPGIDALLKDDASLEAVTISLSDTLSFIPAGPTLQKLESMPKGKGRGLLLKKAIHQPVNDYDFIVMDCPPSSGFLVVNALAAANELVVPVTADYFGMSGLSMLMSTVQNFERVLGRYKRKWFVVSRLQKRKLSEDVLKKLAHYFDDDLVPIHIAERAVLAESPSYGKPVMAYAPTSSSSREFASLAQHIIQRGEKIDDKQGSTSRESLGA
ncbi:ParA family protein [Alteromonas sp. a30]|nr:ParA family protein [Alteromonas sp. a30]